MDTSSITVRYPRGFLYVDRSRALAGLYRRNGKNFEYLGDHEYSFEKALNAAEGYEWDVVAG